jgi:uncharacterized protein YjbI with pentapeptide repeats
MEPPSKKNGSNNQLAGSVYLADILSKHRMWLESGGQKGKRACLVDQDLTNADLSGSDLSEADMSGAVLSFANLQNACLRRAKLVDSTFEHACLHNADFHVADLKCADLEKTSGLLGGKLAGADLTDAKLPESFILLETLDIVKEASLNARKIFFAMLLTCAYALLTLAITEDIKLLTNSVSSTLPIIGTQIRIVNFYRIMPLLLLCIYFYFHLYLQRLWEAQASLPAIFPDGRKLNEKVYPWIMNGLVFKYFERLRNDQPYLIWLQFLLSIVLAWCFVPFTLAALWLRYLRRHDLMTSSFHIFFLVIGVAGGILFYRIAASTLRGDTKKPLIKPPFVDHTKHSKSDSRLNVRLPKLANTGILKFGDQSMIVILCCLLMFFTISVTYCKPLWVLHLFEKAGCSPVMDLTESFISTPPSNWTGESEAEFAFVKGANLKGVNLRMANLQRAFLVRADLRGADLSGANLQEAILLEAKLQGTILRGIAKRFIGRGRFAGFRPAHRPTEA